MVIWSCLRKSLQVAVFSEDSAGKMFNSYFGLFLKIPRKQRHLELWLFTRFLFTSLQQHEAAHLLLVFCLRPKALGLLPLFATRGSWHLTGAGGRLHSYSGAGEFLFTVAFRYIPLYLLLLLFTWKLRDSTVIVYDPTNNHVVMFVYIQKTRGNMFAAQNYAILLFLFTILQITTL